MKRNLFLLLVVFCLVWIVVGCSANDSKEMSEERMDTSSENIAIEHDNEHNEIAKVENDQLDNQDENTSKLPKGAEIQTGRKIIYTANLQIEVKDFQKMLDNIQTKIANYGGYIIETNMNNTELDENKRGTVTARIPQSNFQPFIKVVEDSSSKVLESNVSGQDITEEFVDLESRLKSKKVVEERLISFIKDAKKTEDLLKISNDLAKVQEEIEEIEGRIKYLQNQSDLATVTIDIQEKNVRISNTDELNTWEKVKEQLMKSINFLLSLFSAIIVFFVGNLPVFIILLLFGSFVFFIWRKWRK